MSCEAVVESFVAFLDGETDAGERRTIEQHVGGCASCAAELELLRATRALVSRQLAGAGAGRSAGSFDELWHRIEADQRPLRVVAGGGPRRPARRRLAVWMGAGGLALAAGLALTVVGLQPAGSPPAVAPPSAAVLAQPAPGGQAKAAPRAAPHVVAQAHPKEGTQLAKRSPAQHGDAGDEGADQRVAEVANEIDPPAELLERPDLFLNYPVMRKLDELQHLESVLADPGDEGGAG